MESWQGSSLQAGRLVAVLLLWACLSAEGTAGEWPPYRLAAAKARSPASQDASQTRRLASVSARHYVDIVNITATHKGRWHKLAWPKELAQAGFLQQDEGVSVLKLHHLGKAEGGVLSVEGDIVLRDGRYISASDTMLQLRGVYVPAAGRLMAVVEPDMRLRTARRQHPQQAGDPLTELAPNLDDLALGHGQRRRQAQALQAAARRVAAMAGAGQWEAPDLGELGGGVAAGAAGGVRGWRECGFMLDLRVAPAEGAGRWHPRTGLRGDSSDAAAALRQRWGLGGARSGGGLLPAVVQLNGTLSSRACGVRLALSLSTARVEEYYSKAVNYTLMITALGFLQVLLLVRQMEAVATPALASRVSLLTLAHQAVLDAYLCLVHLTLGIMIESLFNSFGTVAFMQFVVFAIFEMRFLLSVWRARRGGVDPWTAQREVSVLYARFYAALLGGILATYQLQRRMPVLLFAFFSYWWPQIALCVRTDCRQPLKPEFVLGSSAARLALPLYIYACPSNLLRVAPSPALCAALVAYVGLQCGLLLAQHRWGPRCFVPRAMLPRRYDYTRPLPRECGGCSDLEAGDTTRECVICMNQVDVFDKSGRAVTPCSHVFHQACLARWLSYKHDCPTCRRTLPPL